MTELLGLKLEDALKLLSGKGITDVRVVEYSAPRAEKDPRGTLRVVRFLQAQNELIVCAFNDDVLKNNEV